MWVSDSPFGSVVYHYGRWVYISGTGWAWIPGYRYAPAWVSFRVPTGSYAYVGWAPLPPDYIWVGGVAVGFYATPSYYWVFCPSAYAFHSHVNYYVVRDRAFVGSARVLLAPVSPLSLLVPALPRPRVAHSAHGARPGACGAARASAAQALSAGSRR